MSKFKEFFKSHAHVTVAALALVCFIQFAVSLYVAIATHSFDKETINKLLSTADGMEAVLLFLIMLALNNKKK